MNDRDHDPELPVLEGETLDALLQREEEDPGLLEELLRAPAQSAAALHARNRYG